MARRMVTSTYIKTSVWWKTSWVKNLLTHEESYWVTISWIPISFMCCVCLGLGKPFINTSAVCSRSWQFWISRMLSFMRSWTQWCWMVMCLVCWWNCGLCVKVTDPSLSPHIIVGNLWGNPSSAYKFLSQVTLHPVLDNATYSDSVEDRAIMVCFFDFHVIAPPAEIKT